MIIHWAFTVNKICQTFVDVPFGMYMESAFEKSKHIIFLLKETAKPLVASVTITFNTVLVNIISKKSGVPQSHNFNYLMLHIISY